MTTTNKKVLTTQEVATRFNELAQQEKWFDIQDEFFADNAISKDPPDSPYFGYAEGKANVRKKGEDFTRRIEGVHRLFTSEPLVSGNHFAVGREKDITVRGFGRIEIKQIMLYEVKDGSDNIRAILLLNKSNKMKIGIIGAGEMGGTLIQQYTKAGHRVKMANSGGMEKLRGLALETGATAVTLADAVRDVDVIVISIPLMRIPELPQGLLKNIPANTTIIDTGNYYPIRDGVIKDIEDGMPESVWVSNQLERPVIKAYNNIFYRSLVNSGLPEGNTSRVALPVSGDNKQSKDVVSVLVDDSGFDSFDYGSLQDSWRQQPGSPVYCTDLTLTQLKKSIPKARKELLPERRELGLQYILNHDPVHWMDNVEYNRKIYESDLGT